MMHAMFLIIHEKKLHRAPIRPESRILDLCTGSGIWCIDMGDTYPAAHIVGIDICAPREDWVPPGVEFHVGDVENEEDWSFSLPFDYIHSRYNTGVFVDPRKLLMHCYDKLKPLGWIELEDFDILPHSPDSSLTEEHAISRWSAKLREASELEGKSLRFGRELESRVREAGFENIQA